MDSCCPVMTIYKLVIICAPVRGLVELEDYHIMIDGWYRMIMEQVWELEKHTDLLLKKTLQKVAKAGRKHEGKRKSLKDEDFLPGKPDQALSQSFSITSKATLLILALTLWRCYLV